MPRGGGRGSAGRQNFLGNFGEYASGSVEGQFSDDEEAIAVAADTMFTMCGNAGQERLIGDYLADFEDWAYIILETEDGRDDDWTAFVEMVRDDWYNGDEQKWRGTNWMWRVGYDVIASMFGVHDSYDEYGEGQGR